MLHLKELNQQIARVDALLQAAYLEGNKQDIILFAGLMAKLQSRKLEAQQANKPKPLQAWKHTDENEDRLESRILSRDEQATIDF